MINRKQVWAQVFGGVAVFAEEAGSLPNEGVGLNWAPFALGSKLSVNECKKFVAIQQFQHIQRIPLMTTDSLSS